MDIGVYISELLEKYGQISVSGLGFLVQVRMPGYYNQAEGKFYPPYVQLQFDPQRIDEEDNTLAQYIADKKKISLASAKFFIEIYVTNLKEDAQVKRVVIGDLGWFYKENGLLVFRAADNRTNNPAFFGFPPVKITKINQPPVPEPVVNGATVPETTEPESPEEAEAEVLQETYSETERKLSYTWVIVLLIIILIAGLAVFGVYQYSPATFNNALAWEQKITGTTPAQVKQNLTTKKVAPPAVIPVKPDTTDTNKTGNSPDTTKPTTRPAAASGPVTPANVNAKRAPADLPAKQNTPAAIDTSNHWEIIALSCKTNAEANRVISYFSKEGLNAYISTQKPGPRIRIAVGTYNTRWEAHIARVKLTESKKIPKDAYLEEIKLKK